MIGNPHFDKMVEALSADQATTVDWVGIGSLMQSQGIVPDDVSAVTWCGFRKTNIDYGVSTPTLAIVHSAGILTTTGKRRLFGGSPSFSTIDFGNVRDHAALDAPPDSEHRLGIFAITFLGPGQVVLGSLTWEFRPSRFRDSTEEVIALASERDRVYQVVLKSLPDL